LNSPLSVVLEPLKVWQPSRELASAVTIVARTAAL
jgi:hypothetical protein